MITNWLIGGLERSPKMISGFLLKGTRIESQTTGLQITNQSLAENMTK